jgi:4-hydroxybenzoyl-CoA reductase beta subunit
MHLPKFEHLYAASMEEAAQLLNKHGSKARLVAGGTDLFPRMKYRLTHPEILVSLKGLSTREPALDEDGGLILDASMTLKAVVRSPVIREKAPLIAEAAYTVASNEIRNMGTLGGNLSQETRCLYYNQSHDFQYIEPCFKRGGNFCYFIPNGSKCWAVFMSDTAPALICLGAEIRITGPANTRQISLEDLYSGDALQPITTDPDEILAEVLIPKQPTRRVAAYSKFSLRGALEFGALGLAVILDMDDSGKTCLQARIACGSVSPAPLRAPKAESFLKGKGISDTLFSKVAQIVAEEIRIIPHHGYSGFYLKKCIQVQMRRVLGNAVAQINSKREATVNGKEAEQTNH